VGNFAAVSSRMGSYCLHGSQVAKP